MKKVDFDLAAERPVASTKANIFGWVVVRMIFFLGFATPLVYLLCTTDNDNLTEIDSKPIENFTFAGACVSIASIIYVFLMIMYSKNVLDGDTDPNSISISINSIRRHPSSLTMCIVLCSIPSSLLVIVYHLRYHYGRQASDGDNSASYMFVNKGVAFIMQMSLLAREMWVASLSLVS